MRAQLCVLMIIALLLFSLVSVTADVAEENPERAIEEGAEEPGFFAKIWNKIRGSDPSGIAASPPSSGEPGTTDGDGANPPEKGYASTGAPPPEQGGSDNGEWSGQPDIAPAPPPHSVPSNACCSVVICNNQDDEAGARSDGEEPKQFICPYSINSCIEKYGRTCTTVRCKEEPSRCNKEVHTCYVRRVGTNMPYPEDEPRAAPGDEYYPNQDDTDTNAGGATGGGYGQAEASPTVTASGATVSPNDPAVSTIRCEGRYEDCVQRYGSCSCGVREELTGENCLASNGETYRNGESFRASDGCNTCTCSNGRIACTLMACVEEECVADTDCESGECANGRCTEESNLIEPVCGNGLCERGERTCVTSCPDCAYAEGQGRCGECKTKCEVTCEKDCAHYADREQVAS